MFKMGRNRDEINDACGKQITMLYVDLRMWERRLRLFGALMVAMDWQAVPDFMYAENTFHHISHTYSISVHTYLPNHYDFFVLSQMQLDLISSIFQVEVITFYRSNVVN